MPTRLDHTTMNEIGTGKEQKKYRKEIWNQLINLFWTILCFTPLIWFWVLEGINSPYFYWILGVAIFLGILPKKILNLLTFSSGRKFYERFGVKYIRKFVQNGDMVNALTSTKTTQP